MWSCQLFHMQWRWGQWGVFACLDCCWYCLRLSQKVGALILHLVYLTRETSPVVFLANLPDKSVWLSKSLQSANEEVVGLLLEFQNVTALEMAAAVVCIPACQSFLRLASIMPWTGEADNRTTFYCGRNSQGQACYEAFQSNNGARVSSACSNNNCTASCAAELQTLISDVCCYVCSSAYTFLMADSLFSTCRITMPDFCPHPFNSAITTAAAYTSLFTIFMFKECSNELICSAQ